MQPIPPESLLPRVAEVVRRASVLLMDTELNADSVTRKPGEANLVTAVDLQIQAFLVVELRRLVPDACFYCEEDQIDETDQAREGYLFIIDPIDGTTNFVFGYRHSCISVGLALCGQTVLGVVYNPYLREMFTAIRGMGVWLNGQPLQLNNRSLENGIAAFGCARCSGIDAGLIFTIARELYQNSLSLRNSGSAALELCNVAAGRNAVFVELWLQPYDFSAGRLMVEEAGGRVTQADGRPVTLDKPCAVIAGTKQAWRQAFDIAQQTAHATGVRLP